MNNTIFDTHSHYDDEAFDEDREDILSGLLSHNIGRVVNIGVDIPTCKNTLLLAEKYDFVYAAIGFHPSDTKGMQEEDLDWLRAHRKDPKVVAIGEIGLDYHWSESPEENRNQQKWFRWQIALAKEAGLPIVVHSREAAADTMEIIREEKAAECGGIIHCYSYSATQAEEYVRMGFYIGVGGVITFKNSRRLKETVLAIPLESIVLETDCPYLAPEPFRGKRNDSTLLPHVVAAISEIKGVPEEEVIAVTTRNAESVYRLT
ncbi:MAG: TatD family hydrolase [Eubacterium sp.]|nr:TatD family hydrolase [Eubacterium sp.]